MPRHDDERRPRGAERQAGEAAIASERGREGQADLEPGAALEGERPEQARRGASIQRPGPRYGRMTSEQQGDAQDSLVPRLELPKGGGALRSIGESFEANAFTGTGTLSIPVPISPARALTPELALTYSSGAGNGPFGLGFDLSLPHISRRTDRGLPKYSNKESDTFILAEAEDLVPVFEDGTNELERVVHTTDTHRVYPYRPRVDEGFLRIERWVSRLSGDVHWRVTDRDDVTSVFGESAAARVANPIEKYAHQVLRWNLDRRHDDRGNEVWFEYVPEDLEGVDTNTGSEKERLFATNNQAQRYLKRIYYGNRVPDPQGPGDFGCEVVLDYGEHGEDTQTDQVDITADPVRPWPTRRDTFSSFRGGFDLRTRRLCRRILVFHRFAALSGQDAPPRLVRSLDLRYDEQPNVTLLVGVTQRGYIFDDTTGHYDVEFLPEVELGYTERVLPVTGEVETSTPHVHPDSIADLNATVGDGRLRLVDLDGEGIPGLLMEQSGALYYKRAMGGGRYAPQQTLPSRPSHGTAQRLMDLDGDGHLRMVTMRAGGPSGSFRRNNLAEQWEAFQPFVTVPKGFSLDDPHVDLADLDGDGLAEVVHNEGWRLVWYRSRGKNGWDEAWEVTLPRDECAGPQFARNDLHAITMYADMTGDGLQDLVLVTHSSVCYWPNLGRGKFGRKIQMANAPSLGATFSPRWLRLVDVDGTGPADLVYLSEHGARIFFNQAGNGFSEEVRLAGFPAVHSQAQVEVADVYGKGTPALVWSSALATDRGRHIQTLDLLPEGKPFLLTSVRNGMGLETRVRYTSSTQFYLADRAAGKPWATRLPFPVQVIDRVEVVDHARGHRVVSTYTYHHGYFDGPEREFRGFGMVEQRDTESFEHFGDPVLFPTGHEVVEEALHVPPVVTKTWFHTGAYLAAESLTKQYEKEYWQDDENAPDTLATRLPTGLRGEEHREALRALRGKPLRTEVYAEDGTERADRPYQVTEHGYTLRLEQKKHAKNPQKLEEGRYHGVFFMHDRETRSFHYERDPNDPRFVQELVLAVDEFGNALRTAEVAYPRRTPGGPAQDEQSAAKIVVSETDWVNQAGDMEATYQLGTPVETRSFELTGFSAPNLQNPWTPEDVDDMVDQAPAIAFEAMPNGQVLEKRLLDRTQTRYWNDALTAALPHGEVGTRALVHETWAMAFTAAHIADILAGRLGGAALNEALEQEGHYVLHEGAWWTRSELATFDDTRFYLPVTVADPFGNETSITYDDEALLVTQVTDAIGNEVHADHDYRTLQPSLLRDPNGNRGLAASDALGRVTAIAIAGKEGETDPQAQGDTLDHPTRRFEYHPFAWQDEQMPVFVHAFAREQYFPVAENAPVQESVTYSDGAGNVLMEKVLAEPGLAPARDQNGDLVFANGELVRADTSPNPRWVGTGRTILDNKGNPVKQYEPFFSDRPDWENEAELVHFGVTPILHYDPLGRLIRTDYPDGTLERVEFTPWHTETWDRNDTMLESQWHAERDALAAGTPEEDAEKRAAALTEAHAETPTVTDQDVLGRDVVVVEHLRDDDDPPGDLLLETRTVLDISGNVREVFDARGNTAQTNVHGMLGQVLHTTSVDAGDRWSLEDVLGAPLRLFDGLDRTHRFEYDRLRRVTHHFVQHAVEDEALVLRNVWGEIPANPEENNLRGQLLRQYDGAGLLVNVHFDFAGNLRQQDRSLMVVHDAVPDWIDLAEETTLAGLDTAAASLLEQSAFTTETTYDALGRPVTRTTPDGSITRYAYNEGGLLRSVEADMLGATPATVFVNAIEYDVYGRRASVAHGNGATTDYTYDPLSFRVRRIRTTRTTSPSLVQDLHYTYDPLGNVVEIRDHAQQEVYFANDVVGPRQRFEYDALYRLIRAEGREHAVQNNFQRDENEFAPPIIGIPFPNSPEAMQRYQEAYVYDEVGNIRLMRHIGGDVERWTRRYQYAEDGNRLLATSVPGDGPNQFSASYDYDAHGNMIAMPHPMAIDWDHADRMQHADLGGGGDVYFQYDAEGNRVRKVRVNQSESRANERIYLGSLELYRERAVTGGQLGAIDLERETLHIADDTGRIVMVETLTIDGGDEVTSPATTARYQYGNHLGTVSLDLDDGGNIISYEEYHPFGTSAYRAVSSSIEVSPKRYRYAAAERDEETGLDNMGLRYYAPWLGRWTAADPIGLSDGVNRYAYVHGNPVGLRDPSGTLTQDPQPADQHPKPVLETKRELSEAEQKKLRESKVKFGTVERRTPTGELKDPTGLVAEAVHRKFAGHAKTEDFSQEAIRKELEGLPGFKISGYLPEEGKVPVALRGDVALHLAKRFGVPAGKSERLFPTLAPFIEGTGLIDAPAEVKQAAEVTLVLGTLYGAAKAGRALFKLVREKIAQRKAVEAATKEAAKETTEAVAKEGAKNLSEAVGGEEARKLVNQVLKGNKPLSELTPEQRAAAARFFRDVSARTKGTLSKAASEFNRLRADFLEGKTNEVPGKIRDFMKRRGISE